MPIRVLVADDELAPRRILEQVLAKAGYTVSTADGGQEAVTLGREHTFDIALLDVRMPDLDGVAALQQLKAHQPELIVIMMSAFASIDTAVEAMQEGAFDYIRKPFNLDEVILTIQRALERRRLLADNLHFQHELKDRYRIDRMVGSSAQMLDVYKRVARAAPTKSTVLIQGDTGTGKELVARAIHYNSPRADRPFIAIDCSSLTESVLESELFGHIKGAFTGAIANKKGLFEAAEGGTCFLDEVGEVSVPLQAKLLRVLQEREIRPVGSTAALAVDVRIVAATNKNLEQLMAQDQFRTDLFYRLSVVTIRLPALRERRDDIPALIQYFLHKYATDNGTVVPQLSAEALACLIAHDWPGNVRELEHMVEQTATLSSDALILPDDLPPKYRQFQKGQDGIQAASAPLTLQEVTERHIRAMLKHANGNKKLAAELLGIPRRTLYRLAQRYGIDLSPVK